MALKKSIKKVRKISPFLMGLVLGFGQKFEISLFVVFVQNMPKESVLKPFRWKNWEFFTLKTSY